MAYQSATQVCDSTAVSPSAPAATPGFGRRLLDHRRAAGLTQRELAAGSGTSVRTISQLECGRSRGSQHATVDLLADVLSLGKVDREELHRLAAAGRARGRGAPPARPRSADEARCAPPEPPSDFVGRSRELARLRRMADAALGGTGGPGRRKGADGAATIVTVSGQPGLGKTALALRLARECADRFPDGVFHLDLGGAGPLALARRDALARLLRALGVPRERIPSDTEERAGLYRSLTHYRRALVLLDNAADREQVSPLLPTGQHCLTVVTSRRALADLDAGERILLDVLPPGNAVRLLVRTAGRARIAAEPERAAELARLCGYLPLALRIAGNQLAAVRPAEAGATPVRDLVFRLREDEHRLDGLGFGDVQVRTAFSLSYGALVPAARRMFRLLSLAPGPDIGPELAAALCDMGLLAALEVLDELADAGMLVPTGSDFRYRFHDLLRLFAGECLRLDEPAAERAAAEQRMANWLGCGSG